MSLGAVSTVDSNGQGVARGSSATPRSVDALLGLSLDELDGLYEGASVPEMGAVAGALKGRMLATTVLSGRLAKSVERWASSRLFPWRGKSFTPTGLSAGEGINRVVSDRLRLFRFETSIGPSRGGDFDALHLDYDLPQNPAFIRAIEDEIRQLSPGLWLGQAYLRIGRQPVLILYFGLQAP